MAFSSGKSSMTLKDILSSLTEADILSFYLGITRVPCIIKSPLRQDNKPSFGLYSSNGVRINYIDFSTKESGGTFDLLGKMWNCSFPNVIDRIAKDMIHFSRGIDVKAHTPAPFNIRRTIDNRESDLQCKVREWRNYDIEYWESFGISIEWLRYAEVYPISHKIVVKCNSRYVLSADKYAYAYVEHKEGKVTLKIYQPFNKIGYKWSNKHDSSVISLWTKVPEYGEHICICSSLKDALCLWSNTGIPSIAVQGEGYHISDTAISELKRRYKNVFILFDNDEAGLKSGEKLSESTGFTNVVLPFFSSGKDISDYYAYLKDKQKFKQMMLNLFTF